MREGSWRKNTLTPWSVGEAILRRLYTVSQRVPREIKTHFSRAVIHPLLRLLLAFFPCLSQFSTPLTYFLGISPIYTTCMQIVILGSATGEIIFRLELHFLCPFCLFRSSLANPFSFSLGPGHLPFPWGNDPTYLNESRRWRLLPFSFFLLVGRERRVLPLGNIRFHPFLSILGPCLGFHFDSLLPSHGLFSFPPT